MECLFEYYCVFIQCILCINTGKLAIIDKPGSPRLIMYVIHIIYIYIYSYYSIFIYNYIFFILYYIHDVLGAVWGQNEWISSCINIQIYY